MKKYIILIPVYNDWRSVFKLIENIDLQINNETIDVVIVNDASTESFDNNQKQFSKINSVKIINLIKRTLNEQDGLAVSWKEFYENEIQDEKKDNFKMIIKNNPLLYYDTLGVGSKGIEMPKKLRKKEFTYKAIKPFVFINAFYLIDKNGDKNKDIIESIKKEKNYFKEIDNLGEFKINHHRVKLDDFDTIVKNIKTASSEDLK